MRVAFSAIYCGYWVAICTHRLRNESAKRRNTFYAGSRHLSITEEESDGDGQCCYCSQIHEHLLPGLEDVGGDGDCLGLCRGVGCFLVPVFVRQVDVHGVNGSCGGQDVVCEVQALVEVAA